MTSPQSQADLDLNDVNAPGARAATKPSVHPESVMPRPDNRSFLRRHGVKLVASAIITAGILYALHQGGIKFVPDGGDFAAVRWWTLPVYALTLVAMSYFRAVRWRFLLRGIAHIPRRRILAVSWIGFAAILMMPFRIGEFVRPYMIRTPANNGGGKKISLTAATSSVVAERIIDGLFLSLLLAIALIFVPTVDPLPQHVLGLPEKWPVSVHHVRTSGFVMLGVFATAFAVIAVFYFARSWAHKMTMAIVGRVSMKLAQKLATTFEKFADGLAFLGRGRDAWGFLVETTAYWLLNALGMWLLAWGCGVVHADGSAITLGETFALMGMLGVTILIPGPPGLIGLFQVGICAGMTMYFPEAVISGPGAAYIFLLYAMQVVWTLGAGGFFLFGDRRNITALEEAEGIIPAPAETT